MDIVMLSTNKTTRAGQGSSKGNRDLQRVDSNVFQNMAGKMSDDAAVHVCRRLDAKLGVETLENDIFVLKTQASVPKVPQFGVKEVLGWNKWRRRKEKGKEGEEDGEPRRCSGSRCGIADPARSVARSAVTRRHGRPAGDEQWLAGGAARGSCGQQRGGGRRPAALGSADSNAGEQAATPTRQRVGSAAMACERGDATHRGETAALA
ncbi:hypothetical protein Scep_016673 [Stephania cephalantha]|uniref:Uncharacterized protein n=1 Tax=Stephania cephalantha TaxID=152367 RepID=A0AAP0INL7_9MAGN